MAEIARQQDIVQMAAQCSGRGMCLQQYICPSCTACTCEDECSCNCTCDEGPEYVNGCGLPECVVVKCPNYVMCNEQLPLVLLDAHGDRCMACNMFWGFNLEFLPASECMVCFEEQGELVKHPGCTHSTCIACFTKIYYEYREDQRRMRIWGRGSKCPYCRNEMPKPTWERRRMPEVDASTVA
jgi:hypothetical protein